MVGRTSPKRPMAARAGVLGPASQPARRMHETRDAKVATVLGDTRSPNSGGSAMVRFAASEWNYRSGEQNAEGFREVDEPAGKPGGR